MRPERIRRGLELNVTPDEWRAFREACERDHLTIRQAIALFVKLYVRYRADWERELWARRGMVREAR